MTTPIRDDHFDAWYDGSAVCVIAVGSHGDPLDLAEHEVEAFITKLQVCLKQASAGESPAHRLKSDAHKQTLENEANRIQDLIVGKTLTRVIRPRHNEVALEFSDGTRLFIVTKGTPEFSVT